MGRGRKGGSSRPRPVDPPSNGEGGVPEAAEAGDDSAPTANSGRPARRRLVLVVALVVVAGTAAGIGLATGGGSGVPAAALEGLHFTDVTRAAGLDSPQSARTLSDNNSMTGGVAACDFFGNGLTDFYVTRVGLPNELFRNNGNGTFTNVAARAGVEGPDWRVGYSGATCGDLNGDGRPDLFVTSAGGAGNVLYLNNGNGTFSNVTSAAGLSLPPSTSHNPSLTFGSAFGDYNHDGRLDIAVVQWNVTSIGGRGSYGGAQHLASLGPCGAEAAQEMGPTIDNVQSRSRLYQNDGNGPDGVPRFTDVTTAMGLDLGNVLGFTPTFVDLTGNGWDDLVISGDACTSQIYLNEDGKRFVDITPRSGANTAQNGMGSVFADLTGNGRPDWFETSIYYPGHCPTTHTFVGCSGNRLYLNQGGGKFTDATDRFGVRDGGWGWGAVAADLNNSGRNSLLEVDGMLWAPNQVIRAAVNPLWAYYRSFVAGRPYLWLNDGSTPFPEVAGRVGLTATGQEKAVVPVDYRNDGKLGLFITNTGGDPVLYQNDSTNHNGWVELRLRDDTTENRFGVGAEVRIQARVGGPVQYQELLDGGSYESSDPLLLHFGFGAHVRTVSSISVRWPGTSSFQVLHDVSVDRIVTITRP